MPFVQLREFDDAGLLLSGGKIQFYRAGTTTPAPTYQDAQGATANPNPVILNDAGSAKIFLLPIKYRVVIYDVNDVLIHEIDEIGSGAGGSGEGSFAVVKTYDELRDLGQDYDAVLVLGRDEAGDGAGGLFWKTDSTIADDDGIVLVRQSLTRYKRALNGYIDPVWFGLEYDLTVDQNQYLIAAFEASIEYNLPVYITGNAYLLTNMTVPSGAIVRIYGKIYGPALNTPTVTFEDNAVIEYCADGGFAVPVKLGASCVDGAINSSWFAGGDDVEIERLSNISDEGYTVYINKDYTLTTDVSFPANLAVDFVAGCKFIADANIDIVIDNLLYKGLDQIVRYNNISHIGAVKLGTGYTYLEWFGGSASEGLDVDNSIPFLACLKSGKLFVHSTVGTYLVKSGTYTVTNNVEIAGSIPNGVSDLSVNEAMPSTIKFEGSVITVAGLTLDSVRFDGYGTINSTALSATNSVISNTIAVSTGLTGANDILSVSPQYLLVGASGKIALSPDSTTWSDETVGSFGLTSIAYNGKLYVAVGASGAIFTSVDGATWVSRTSGTTANFTRVKYANNKFVAVGASGVLSSSSDGITWNTQTVVAFDIRSLDWSATNALWIIVGASGKIYTSADLSIWTLRTVTGLTGTIYDVHCTSSKTVIVGANGLVYTSADLSTWTSHIPMTTAALQSVKYYANRALWVAGSSTGQILTSTNGINWKIVSTYTGLTDGIYDQIEINGQLLFAASTGYLLSTFDLKKFTVTQPVNAYSNYGICGKVGKVIAVADAGKIVESTDLLNWTEQASATTANLLKAKLINGVYYVLGASGTYLTSYDGSTWTVRSCGATDIHDLAVNAGSTLFVAVCAGGKIYTSADPIATTPVWTERTSGSSEDLNVVLFEASNWWVYGDNGAILKSADGANWTNMSVAASAFSSNGIIVNGTTKVYFGANGNIVSTTDGVTYVKRVSGTTVNLLSGCYGNSMFVVVGQNGVVLSSPDGVTWTLRTSGSSDQLNRVVYSNSYFAIAGFDSTILKSTDGITWSNAAISFDGGAFGGGLNFNSIKYIYGEWYAVGQNGAIVYGSDLANWSSTIPDYKNGWPIGTPDKEWVEVFGAIDTGTRAVGCIDAAGYAIQTSEWGAARWFAMSYALEAGDTFARGNGDLLVGGSGTIYKVSGGSRPSPDFLGPTAPVLILTKLTTDIADDLIDVVADGTGYIAISNYSSYTSADQVNWTNETHNPTDNIDAVEVDGSTYYLLSNGKLLSTTDNMIFEVVKDTSATNFQKVDSTYYLTGEVGSVVETASAPSADGFTKHVINSDAFTIQRVGSITLNGEDVIYYLTTDGKILLGSVAGIALNVTGKASIYNSLLDVKVVNTVAGPISKSKLVSVAKIEMCDDTTFSNLDGAVSGNISRCTIAAYQPISIEADLYILDSRLTQKSLNTELISVATGVYSVSFTNCTLDLAGMMLYSEDGSLIVNIYGGFINSQYALTNGFARIYLNAVFKTDGTKFTDNSVFSKDGVLFEAVELATEEVISDSLTAWYNVNKTDLEIEGSYLKAKEDIPMSNNLGSPYALRFRKATAATKMLFELGGKIQLDVEFPAGVDPEIQAKVKLRPVLYTPATSMVSQLVLISSRSFGYYANTSARGLTGSEYAGCSKDSAKLRNTAYVWSGSRELGLSVAGYGPVEPKCRWWYDQYGDRYGITYLQDVDPLPSTEIDGVSQGDHVVMATTDIPGISQYTKTPDPLDYIPYIVIASESNCVLPKGTKIKVTIIPTITSAGFDAWFGDTIDTSIDVARGVEYRFLNLVEINSDNIVLRTIRNPDSALFDEQEYLGVDYVYSYLATTYYQIPDPDYNFPALNTLSKNIRINVEGLKPNPTAKMMNTNFNLFTKGHYKANGVTGFALLTDTVCTSYRPDAT